MLYSRSNLFVDDVERQDAERVVFLHFARRSELAESALGHSRKDVDHRVNTLFLVALGERNYVETERQKRPIEERVHQEHLTCNDTNHIYINHLPQVVNHIMS